MYLILVILQKRQEGNSAMSAQSKEGQNMKEITNSKHLEKLLLGDDETLKLLLLLHRALHKRLERGEIARRDRAKHVESQKQVRNGFSMTEKAHRSSIAIS